ncbi:hypothetical protein EDD41_0329 [Luteococcus japonicus]|nr:MULTISPECIES: hypothetical protein [Luteococcus]MDN5562544.1 hypothetical protein [Luteococcus sp.]ROR53199.1 hypothetical protein EDD41_0329 [Luteococcus japonicus]
MAEAKKKPVDPTLVIVLLVCVIVGMVQGARGVVRGASAGWYRASAVAVENVETFTGSLRVSTSACKDTAGLDQVRYQVEDRTGREVSRQEDAFVAGRARQEASVGKNLPAGRYTVTVSCLSDGKPTGQAESTNVTVGKNSKNSKASTEGRRPSGLPHTGN